MYSTVVLLLHCCLLTSSTLFGSNSQTLLGWKLSLFSGGGQQSAGVGSGRQVRFTPALAFLTGNLIRPLNSTTFRPPVGGATTRPAALTTVRPITPGAVTTRPVTATLRPGVGVGVTQQQVFMYPGGQFYPGYLPQQGPYNYLGSYPNLGGPPFSPGLYGQATAVTGVPIGGQVAFPGGQFPQIVGPNFPPPVGPSPLLISRPRPILTIG